MKHQCRAYYLTIFAVITTFCQFSASTHHAHAGENYAFLVAVGDYDVKHLKPLAYTRNDILEFKTLLLKSGFPKENIVLLHDDLKQLSNKRFIPNAEEIRKEFTLLVSGLEPDDTLIVAMAGHGVQFKDDKSSYFCPADADLDDEKHERLISFGELYKGLEQCEARKKLLLIDACRNDPQSQLSRSRAKVKLQSITRPQSEPVPEGIVALFSCSAGEQAYEWPDLKHGIFFHHLLEGWKGAADDGDLSLSLDELVSYTRKKTQTFARLNLASIQRPQRLGKFSGTWKLRKLEDPDYELGLKLYLGEGMLMDQGRAYKLFRKAAGRGHTLAKTFVAIQYAKGDHGLQKDFSQAINWFESLMPALRTLADEGNPVAQKQLGSMYYLRKDYAESLKWTRKAAEQNDVLGLQAMGSICLYGFGVEQNEAIAVEWFRKAAEQKYAVAQFSLAVMFESGQGVERNYNSAMQWYHKAAKQNYATAYTNLGRMYQNGLGIQKDDYEAVKWYRIAAEQGHAIGQSNLGTMYRDGTGVAKNDFEAVKWFRKGTDQGNELAQVNLGYMFSTGRGVQKNDFEAVKWYRKSADQGNDVAQLRLGYMFSTGRGVQKSSKDAVYWYRKSAKQGNASAISNLKKRGLSP